MKQLLTLSALLLSVSTQPANEKAKRVEQYQLADGIIVARVEKQRAGAVLKSLPPIYVGELQLTPEETIRGAFKKGLGVSVPYRVQQNDEPVYPVGKIGLITLEHAKRDNAWIVRRVVIATTENIEEAKEAVGKKDDKKPLRVLFFVGSGSREFTVVLGALAKERKAGRMEIDLFSQAGEPDEAGIGARLLREFPDRFQPDDAEKKVPALANYDVVVAFDPDWTKLSAKQRDLLEDWVKDHAGGLLFVAGQKNTHQLAHAEKLKLNPIAGLLPVVLKDHRLPERDQTQQIGRASCR